MTTDTALPGPLTASSAQGEDRSGYQPVRSWGSNSFAFMKATEGLGFTDPAFAGNWANARAQGLVRGAYCFVHPSESAVGQAALFLETVAAHGLNAGDILALDIEITSGADGMPEYASGYAAQRSAVKLSRDAVLDGGAANSTVLAMAEICKKAFPHNPVVIYTSESVGHTLTSCASFPLWIAYPSPAAPTAIAPWGKWTFWQWAFGGGQGGGDRDAFNGTVADLQAWIKTYLPPAPTTQPSGVHGSARWTNATISWSPGHGAVSYEVYLAKPDNTTVGKVALPASATSFTFRHLHMGTHYRLGVLAKPDAGVTARYVDVTTK